jgi:hypothetical protein
MPWMPRSGLRLIRAGDRTGRDDNDLEEFFVWWDDVDPAAVDALSGAIEAATGERDMQRFLQDNPTILVQSLGGGHGRWVMPQARLGREFVTDFVVGERSTVGFRWLAVELENPRTRLFTRSGDPSRTLNHAIRQIVDWRAWLRRNQDYASRPRTENGLGLRDIDQLVPGLILIGRRDDQRPEDQDRRRSMEDSLGIHIHSYDWLVDQTSLRVRELGRS